MNVSVLVPAHNEADNIQNLLESLARQRTKRARITEIVVIASGCTDDTAALSMSFSRGRPGVHVVVQERRRGKVAAINEYLRIRDPRAKIIVSTSADLWVEPDAVERIVRFFEANPQVGMVGAHPVPENDGSTLVGRMVQLLWDMHHRVALQAPKMGELVAFRAELVEMVSELSIVDEASIEDIVRSKGYELGYVPDAVVRNHGPETLDEYFEQRRRIARGHYWLDFAFGYRVATMDRHLLARTALEVLREQDALGKRALVAAVTVEIAARAAGFYDARVRGKRSATWRRLSSTKRVTAGQAPEPTAESLPPPRRSIT